MAEIERIERIRKSDRNKHPHLMHTNLTRSELQENKNPIRTKVEERDKSHSRSNSVKRRLSLKGDPRNPCNKASTSSHGEKRRSTSMTIMRVFLRK